MAGTETKAQRVERLKRELNPWEAYAEIQRFAREGWDAIPAEWLGTYFRWWGIYTQGDGIGAIGGKGGEGKATRHFMVRIRIPNGQLQAHQLRTIAGLAERYARGIADITVRQNIQLHWVTLESLPDVFQTLWRTGITTLGTCGDVTRNVTGCPLAGVDPDEIVDALEPGAPDDPPEDVYRDHVGLHRQKQEGLVYAGVAILRGRLGPAEMRVAADLAERYGTGELRTTNMQNLLIPHVRRERAGALARELEAAGLRLDASPFWRGTVACTGSEFCKLALTETKGFARALVEELESRLRGCDEHVKLHVTGCPNSCGRHWIADLGIEGKKVKVDGALVDAYYFCVGGALGRHWSSAAGSSPSAGCTVSWRRTRR